MEFSSRPYISHSVELCTLSLLSFSYYLTQESEPEIMMLISQKKLRLREAKSLPASSATGQQWSQEAGPGL